MTKNANVGEDCGSLSKSHDLYLLDQAFPMTMEEFMDPTKPFPLEEMTKYLWNHPDSKPLSDEEYLIRKRLLSEHQKK